TDGGRYPCPSLLESPKPETTDIQREYSAPPTKGQSKIINYNLWARVLAFRTLRTSNVVITPSSSPVASSMTNSRWILYVSIDRTTSSSVDSGKTVNIPLVINSFTVVRPKSSAGSAAA